MTISQKAHDEAVAELQARIDTMEAEKAANVKPITLKVSEKKAVSMYGINARFPITVYAGQWQRIARDMFGMDNGAFEKTALGTFIKTHKSQLAWK